MKKHLALVLTLVLGVAASSGAIAAKGGKEGGGDKSHAEKPAQEKTVKERPDYQFIPKYSDTLKCVSCMDERRDNSKESKSCDDACTRAGMPRD